MLIAVVLHSPVNDFGGRNMGQPAPYSKLIDAINGDSVVTVDIDARHISGVMGERLTTQSEWPRLVDDLLANGVETKLSPFESQSLVMQIFFVRQMEGAPGAGGDLLREEAGADVGGGILRIGFPCRRGSIE